VLGKKKEEPEKPIAYYKYRNVKVKSINEGSDVTFVFPNGSTKWCFFDWDEFGEFLVKALRHDYKLNVLVYRFFGGTKSEEIFGSEDEVVDWLEEVVRSFGN